MLCKPPASRPPYLIRRCKATRRARRLRGLHAGEYRLLYVAPERLMLSGFLAGLRQWNVNLFAVDEAHCISEWGHDFRPEYRRNWPQLRGAFRRRCRVLALTATATTRVRADIVERWLARAGRARRELQPAQPHLPRRWPKRPVRTRRSL